MAYCGLGHTEGLSAEHPWAIMSNASWLAFLLTRVLTVGEVCVKNGMTQLPAIRLLLCQQQTPVNIRSLRRLVWSVFRHSIRRSPVALLLERTFFCLCRA